VHHRFIAHDVAMQAARATLSLLRSAPKRYRRLAQQCEEAVVSAPSLPKAQVTL